MSSSESLLRGTTIFADASTETLRCLGEYARLTRAASGEAVFHKGEQADELLLVRRGIVQIVRPGLERMTLGIFGPREPIGLSAMLGRGVYPADAIAACDVEVVRVPAALVLEAMESDNGFVRAINRGLVAHTHALQAKIEMLTAGEVSARLVMLIRHLSERFGDEDESGGTFVPVVLSRGDLARLVGARSETVIRVMSRWQKAKLIETNADGFRILDPALLAET